MINQTAKALDRTQAQCERILNAAEQCFIKYGFHAASMANISDVAGMSPGLIYRYFDNKAAIIKAIVERQLGIMRSDIGALLEGADFVAMIEELFAGWQRGNSRGMSPLLYLELTAEATRDPEIAKAADMTDSACAAGFHAWVSQLAKTQGHDLDEGDVEQSALALRCFIDGLALRAVREPGLDPRQIGTILKQFVSQLFSRQS